MAYIPPYGAGDAVAAQAADNVRPFTSWLASNNLANQGIITEVGITTSCQAGTDPNDSGAIYDPAWENVLQQTFEAYNRANLHVTGWTVAEWGINLKIYRTDDNTNKPLNYRTTASSVVENNLKGMNGVTAERGIVYGGGDFSSNGGSDVINRSHLSQPGAGYYYPHPGSFAVLAARGLTVVRIAVLWERIQPTLKGALDPVEMAAITTSVNAANAAGIKVIFDLHNYARYDTLANGTSGGVYILGQNAPATHNGATVGGTMSDCFADVWTRIMNYYNTGQLWAAELTNEPHDCPNGVTDWQAASRQAVEAIRLVSPTAKIVVGGYSYSSVLNWITSNGSTPWLTETIPAGQTGAGSPRNTDTNILWCGHQYFDRNSSLGAYSGTYTATYASELSSAQSSGYASWTTAGYTAPATNNTLQTGLRSFLNESFDSNPGVFASYVSTTNQGNPNGIAAGSNTITLPFAAVGNPGNSMKIVATTTSDEGSYRRALTGSSNSRIVSFDFQLDPASTVSPTSDFCIAHFWSNSNANDLVEIRIIGVLNNPGLFKMKINTTGTGYPAVTGTTLFGVGVFQNVQLTINDSAFLLTMNGGGTPEITYNTATAGITVNNAGQNIGGIALGKFYGNQAVTMYYDNFLAGINATYYAPPNGGKLTAAIVAPSANPKGLIGFI